MSGRPLEIDATKLVQEREGLKADLRAARARIAELEEDCHQLEAQIEGWARTEQVLRTKIAELEARQSVVTITDEMVVAACRSYFGDRRGFAHVEGMRDAITAALAVAGDGERVKHLKRGSVYRVLCRAATMQSETPVVDMTTDLVVYQCESDGRVWVRHACEFDDGRFAPLSPAPKEGK